ncbi:hypothetical protein [Clostridium amazonitimonense]|uniref:hypothetical protein n=1 Tax=Clostridium amazonitimonense TaxID=1499689 RepID=UPI0005099B41|nr:hypothetical protein [Clostridium amazonitimonense]
MFRTFVNSFKVSFVENANSLIYSIKRIPLIGKKVPENLYKQTKAKLIIGVIRKIFGVLGGFLGKAFYLGLMVILPSYLITKDKTQILPEFLHIFFFLSFVLGSFMNLIIFDTNNKSAFNMITLMRSNPKEYYLGQILYRNIEKFIYFLIPMIIIGIRIEFSPLKAIMLITELAAFRLIGEWLHLYIYDKRGKFLSKNNFFIYSLIIVGLALAYVLPLIGLTINFQSILFNFWSLIITLILGSLAFIYIWKYKKYTTISKTLLTKDNLFNIETFKSDLNFVDVKLDENKLNTKDLNTKTYDKKQGYEYLNSLFFLRHRRIMVDPIKRRVIAIVILFLIAMYFVIFMPSKKVWFVETIKRSTPLLVFIMYSLSTGERISKAMFYNCDVSLLRYSYYRDKKVILSNFTSRLKRVVILNIIPALTLCIAIAVIMATSASVMELFRIIPLFLCILCLSCFFSIHYLFMYYVIQPYTKELTVKSPLFKIINGLVYFLSYMCLKIKTSSYFFTLGVLIITTVYIIIALILTYRLAPKTFKLK